MSDSGPWIYAIAGVYNYQENIKALILAFYCTRLFIVFNEIMTKPEIDKNLYDI